MNSLVKGNKGKINLRPKSADGTPREVENVTYTSSNDTVITVAADGSFEATGVGQCVVSIVADARIGDGVIPLQDTLVFEVLPDEATTLNPEVVLGE